MDATRFDTVARVVGQGIARRRLLLGLLGAVTTGVLGQAEAAAKGKRSHHRRHGFKTQRGGHVDNQGNDNDQGGKLKPDGATCTKDAQCRSGRCVKPDRKPGRCGPACTCVGKACGQDDGCGNPCQGSCEHGLTCCRGACTSLGTPVDCRACDDTCTGLNGECTAGICDPGNGCTSVPTNEGAPCQGNTGTCQSGQCQVACVPRNDLCLGARRTCCDAGYTCGDNACGTTSACIGTVGASCAVNCDCLFYLVCDPSSQKCVETS